MNGKLDMVLKILRKADVPVIKEEETEFVVSKPHQLYTLCPKLFKWYSCEWGQTLSLPF